MTSQQNYRVASFVSGLFGKAPCKVATTADITLSGEQTINTVAVLEGDRVLVMEQTLDYENGIYTVEQGAWNRAGDFDGNRDIVKGTMVTVERPSGAFDIYNLTVDVANIGVSTVTFELFLSPTVSLGLQEVTDVGAATTNAVEALNLILTEAGIPASPGAGKGRVWVKNTTPAELWWTNDVGAHVQLGTGGTGGLTNVIEDTTPELGGPLGCLDEEVQRPDLVDYAISSSSPSSTAGAITFDLEVSNAFEVTLDENITSITLDNPPASGKYGELVIKFVQDGTGSWTVAWPASVNWPGGVAPTITTTATTGTDMVHLATWDGGTTWFATVAQDFS